MGALTAAAVLAVVGIILVARHAATTPGGAEMVIKALYCVFLGLLVVLFVAWAVIALYPAPAWETEYPGVAEYGPSAPDKPTADELQGLSPADRTAKFQDYEARSKEHEAGEKQHAKLRQALQKKVETHDRNASLISLLAAVVVMALGVGFSGRLPVIAEGFLLGGFFTLIFSIGFSFATSPRIAVIPVGVGLIVTIALGYKRFVRPAKS